MSNPGDRMQIQFDDVNRNPISPTTTAATSRNSNNEGRVARPIRRRSRASRRTPTTLLNTDTTNFRAMVQQFTGSPTTTHLSSATGVLDFTHQPTPTTASASGFPAHDQYHNHMQQQQQHQQYMFMMNNMHAQRGVGGGSSHAPPESSSPNVNRDFDNYMFRSSR